MNRTASLIAIAMDWSEHALALAVYAGAWAGLFAIVVLVINVLFRRWLSSRAMGFLWGVVLLRLLVPVAPSSSVSLQNLLPTSWTAAAAPREMARPVDAAPGGEGYSHPLATTAAVAQSQMSGTPDAAPQAAGDAPVITMFRRIAILTWFCGAAACLVGTVLIHGQFCRRVNKVAACDDPGRRHLWGECCQQAGVRRTIPIVMFDGVEQPAVLGLLRPRLLLPPDVAALGDDRLRMIMLHELAHVRRWHIAGNWALVVIRAVHWWNPVYWLAAARFQSLREQSCDAFAISRIEGQPMRTYSELLLTLSQRPQSGAPWRVVLPVSLLGFVSSYFRKRAVRNRLQALRSAGVLRSRWHTAAIAALVGLVAACGLTDARSPEKPIDRSSDWFPRAGQDWDVANPADESDQGPDVTRIYDLEKVLNRIAADKPTSDDALRNMRFLLMHLLRYSTGRSAALSDDWSQERLIIDGSRLTVRAPLEAQTEFAKILSAWERSGLGQICIETRFLTDQRDLASVIGVPRRYFEAFTADDADIPEQATVEMPVVRAKAAVDEYLPIAVANLTAEQAIALSEAASADSQAKSLYAPKVTVFNGQTAMLMDITQKPFVVGIQHSSTGVPLPKIAVVDEGVKLNVRAVQSADAKSVHLDGRVELSEINEVRDITTTVRGEPATIQIPRVKRCRIDVASEIPDGQSLLIGCIPTYERKSFFYVLLTVRNLGP